MNKQALFPDMPIRKTTLDISPDNHRSQQCKPTKSHPTGSLVGPFPFSDSSTFTAGVIKASYAACRSAKSRRPSKLRSSGMTMLLMLVLGRSGLSVGGSGIGGSHSADMGGRTIFGVRLRICRPRLSRPR
jgi:hypothetical protein